MDERLNELDDKEKQQYLEGLVHALDAVIRLANPSELTPFERENFIEASISAAYSETIKLNLDSEKHMKKLIETNSKYLLSCYLFAEIINNLIGKPLTFDQKLRLQKTQALAQIKFPE